MTFFFCKVKKNSSEPGEQTEMAAMLVNPLANQCEVTATGNMNINELTILRQLKNKTKITSPRAKR